LNRNRWQLIVLEGRGRFASELSTTLRDGRLAKSAEVSAIHSNRIALFPLGDFVVTIKNNCVESSARSKKSLVGLFKRLPSLRWSPPRDQQIVPMQEQTQSQAFIGDFKTLENELMPHFRELDAEALRVQNQFRLQQVTLIFGGALATILGALHARFGAGAAVWAGIIESVLAAVLSAVALRAQGTHAQERYLRDRLKAEKLRTEYFLFLGHVGPYTDEQERLPSLIRRVADIRSGELK
jgi:hypothetical protein